MAAGVFGYLGYDMVRLMEELPPPNPDPIGIPDAILVRPTLIVVFDAVKDAITRGHAGAAGAGRRRPRPRCARAIERLAGVVDALDRPLDQVARRRRRRPARRCRRSRTPRRPNTRRMVRAAKDYIAAGDIFQVVLSQRFEAPFTLPPFSLYRALRRINPSPFLYLPRLRRLRGRRLEPGNPGAGARRHGHHPPDRRHAAARRDAARGQGAGGRAARRSEGARRAPDAARSRPQRRRPRRRDRHRQGHRPVLHRALQPRDAHRLERRGQARREARRARRAGRRLSGRHGLGRAEGARHADHRRTGEGKARALRRLRRLFLRRRRDGHLHRAAHRAGQGRHDVRAGRRRHRRRQRSRQPSSRNASTRPRRCSAPPKRRAASPAPPNAGNEADHEPRSRAEMEA